MVLQPKEEGDRRTPREQEPSSRGTPGFSLKFGRQDTVLVPSFLMCLTLFRCLLKIILFLF